jgi:hypothetical protein
VPPFRWHTGPVLDEALAARWVAFPIAAVPRPIVLLEQRLQLPGGFVDSAAKVAWIQGAIEVDVPLPPGLAAQLPVREAGRAETTLKVTEVSRRCIAAFRCDRGLRELPAYQLRVTGLNGFCVVLDPQVECWWPADATEAGLGSGGRATVDEDGLTIHFPAFGGVLTEFHRAEFEEHPTYVVGRAITSRRSLPPGTAVPLIGITRAVVGRLDASLDGRVLVDDRGRPLAVTSGSAEEPVDSFY